MERRNFLGSVIGFVAGTQIPWKATEPTYKTPCLHKQKAHFLRAFHLKENKLKLFKGICVLDTGEEILAPPIKEIVIERTEFGHVLSIDIKFKDIKIEQKMVFVKFKLVDDLGFRFNYKRLTPLIYCKPKNIVKIHYDFSAQFFTL